MMTEIDVGGVYIPPFLLHLIEAGVAFLLCRWILARLRLLGLVWHPALFELAVYVGVLSSVVMLQ